MKREAFVRAPALCAVLLLATAPGVRAQLVFPTVDQAAAQPAQRSGPLVIEPVKSGFVVAPEYKVTDIDGKTGSLIGGFGGWTLENTFLIGGGGYWLANQPNDLEMGYGGLVVGWYVPASGTVRFGTRALVGGGWATIPTTIRVGPPPGYRPTPHDGGYYTGGYDRRVFYDQGFFVFEPQADVVIRFADWVRLSAGVGYRVVGAAEGAEDRLRGVTGSIAFQFGGGS